MPAPTPMQMTPLSPKNNLTRHRGMAATGSDWAPPTRSPHAAPGSRCRETQQRLALLLEAGAGVAVVGAKQRVIALAVAVEVTDDDHVVGGVVVGAVMCSSPSQLRSERSVDAGDAIGVPIRYPPKARASARFALVLRRPWELQNLCARLGCL